MSTKLYSICVRVYATAYIKASSHAEARSKARKLFNTVLELPPGKHGEVEISGKAFTDPDLPDISLSPAMTVYGIDDSSKTERVDQ